MRFLCNTYDPKDIRNKMYLNTPPMKRQKMLGDTILRGSKIK